MNRRRPPGAPVSSRRATTASARGRAAPGSGARLAALLLALMACSEGSTTDPTGCELADACRTWCPLDHCDDPAWEAQAAQCLTETSCAQLELCLSDLPECPL